MIEHPGAELQVLIKEKGLTQKAFASILGKKVSEVNELLKGKRNITIQRDYLLHQTIGTPIKYRILKQVDYDYSLIDVDDNFPLLIEDNQCEVSQNYDTLNNNEDFTETSPLDKGNTAEQKESKSQKAPTQKQKREADEDFKIRARIFKSF